ncbi:hypothetical protein C8J57DRAFT_1722278 [Mycena rebaudengoi]|nr:hypothetical protein C8J57DRAFT_1722278 [Mycena rebaudengoi]
MITASLRFRHSASDKAPLAGGTDRLSPQPGFLVVAPTPAVRTLDHPAFAPPPSSHIAPRIPGSKSIPTIVYPYRNSALAIGFRVVVVSTGSSCRGLHPHLRARCIPVTHCASHRHLAPRRRRHPPHPSTAVDSTCSSTVCVYLSHTAACADRYVSLDPVLHGVVLLLLLLLLLRFRYGRWEARAGETGLEMAEEGRETTTRRKSSKGRAWTWKARREQRIPRARLGCEDGECDLRRQHGDQGWP